MLVPSISLWHILTKRFPPGTRVNEVQWTQDVRVCVKHFYSSYGSNESVNHSAKRLTILECSCRLTVG